MNESVAKRADAGAPDAGPPEAVGIAVKGGTADAGAVGGGICMHDLFDFSEPNPSWMLWVSMASFRETSVENAISATLTNFNLGRQIHAATGIDPGKDAAGVLVTSNDVFDSRSFRVVTSYDSGENSVLARLKKTQGAKPDFKILKTEQGFEISADGAHDWYLVGSGRVLVSNGVPRRRPSSVAPKKVDGGVKAKPSETKPDGGVKAKPSETLLPSPYSKPKPADAGPAAPPKRKLPPGSFPDWPRQIECLSCDETIAKKTEPDPKNPEGLLKLARSFLKPDEEGHWPVALLATRDPRTVGLRSRRAGKPRFQFAAIRAYFTDPIRIEGALHFEGSEEEIAALAGLWLEIAGRTSKDPFFAMAGLSTLLDGLVLKVSGKEITFSLNLTEGKVRAALIFMQLQGESLERHLKQ
ncbi:MAG: hypothetical protein GY854_07605 [Deltaproteobacteria bacterium]|nr:hypothetical protein [Deltaproteobacteria bacterium]